jgi:hypothetical protein
VATKSALQLTFLTDQNRKVRISIPNPKQPIDANAVNRAMDLIVSKGIFAFPQGKIVSKVDAVTIQTDTNSVV